MHTHTHTRLTGSGNDNAVIMDIEKPWEIKLKSEDGEVDREQMVWIWNADFHEKSLQVYQTMICSNTDNEQVRNPVIDEQGDEQGRMWTNLDRRPRQDTGKGTERKNPIGSKIKWLWIWAGRCWRWPPLQGLQARMYGVCQQRREVWRRIRVWRGESLCSVSSALRSSWTGSSVYLDFQGGMKVVSMYFRGRLGGIYRHKSSFLGSAKKTLKNTVSVEYRGIILWRGWRGRRWEVSVLSKAVVLQKPRQSCQKLRAFTWTQHTFNNWVLIPSGSKSPLWPAGSY